MERTSQLILRNKASLTADDVLLLNPPADHLFQELMTAHRGVRVCSQGFGAYRWFSDHAAEAEFAVLPDASRLTAQVIFFLPREKERLEMWLHFLAATMPTTGNLWLVGENRSGIKSAAGRLKNHFSSVAKSDAARHCVLFRAREALSSRPFRLDEYQQKWLLGSPPRELRMVSLPGTFAHGRLDRGTELLLQVLSTQRGDDRPRGSVLDFACGIGVIGLYLLQHEPALDLTLLDDSALALESARRSLQANQVQAKLLPSDGLSEVVQRYDWIISNPPFHQGVTANFDIARRFFARAPAVLTRQGRLLLVCNRHLPYEGWLADHFASVESLAEKSDYKVLRAARPKTTKNTDDLESLGGKRVESAAHT